ncbi:MAG TPA: hypothetical protein PKB06_02695, partial [Actinotalea sp.]|nr:hypothetical protein [Actinotalea sp.]
MTDQGSWNERTTQQLVRYEALFELLDDIQATDDLDAIAQAAAVRWKYVASAAAVRLVVRATRGDFVVLDAARGSGSATGRGGLEGWDAVTWAAARPTRSCPPFAAPPHGPPAHLSTPGVAELVTLPVLRGEHRVGSLAMAMRRTRFEEIDLRFAGQLARQRLQAGFHAQPDEQRPGAVHGLAAPHAGGEQRHRGVLRGREGGQQVVLLEDEAEMPPPEEHLLARGQARGVLAEDLDLAAGAVEQAGDDGDEGRLAAAARADQEGELAGARG